MTMRWFLDDLGLSDDASTQSIKRAAVEPPPPRDPAADPRIIAQKCVSALGDDLKQGRWASQACEHQWHRARAIHPEAGLLFETELLDALIHTRLPYRRALFPAAYKLCGWSDAEHVRSLGANAPWITLVLEQETAMRAAYETLPPAVKLLPLLEGEDDHIPERTLAQWPRMHDIILTYPQYLSLTIDSARFKAWNAAYRELQARPTAPAHAPAAPPPMPAVPQPALLPVTPPVTIARPHASQAQRPAWVSWTIQRRGVLLVCTAAFCVMVYLVARISAPAEPSIRPGYIVPSPSLVLTLPEHTKTSVDNCDYIDVVVHQPTWKLPQEAEQQRRFAEVITECMAAQHWHARTSPDAVLERLGVHT